MQTRSLDEVDRVLDALAHGVAREAPLLVTVSHPSAGAMSIGLGHRHAVLSHVPADGNPPYALLRGSRAPEPEPLSFADEGESSEFPPWASIELELARKCLRDFCATGALRSDVTWELG